MKRIDLHTHSLCSDGAQVPADVVRTAKEAGLAAIALSDHDCIDGVQEAMDAGKALGVEVIPAVELSAQSDTELHILGYFIDIHNKKLQDMMAYALQVRDERQEEVCRKLNEQGFDITMDELLKRAVQQSFIPVTDDRGYFIGIVTRQKIILTLMNTK